MHYQAMLVGQFLKAAEFGTGEMAAQPTYTVANVVLEKLESIAMNDQDGGGAGKLKTKGIIYFRELDRGWVLNRTNAECMAAMFGKETNDWVGKRVTLFAADVRVGPKMDLGIRVKGSPDLEREVLVQVKLPRRKPTPMRLVVTATSPLDRGRVAARHGSASLLEWWGSLTAAEKKSLKPALDGDLKALAAAADAAQAPESAPEPLDPPPPASAAPVAPAQPAGNGAARPASVTFAVLSDRLKDCGTSEGVDRCIAASADLPPAQQVEFRAAAEMHRSWLPEQAQ